jgi:hypothetical protein
MLRFKFSTLKNKTCSFGYYDSQGLRQMKINTVLGPMRIALHCRRSSNQRYLIAPEQNDNIKPLTLT